MRKLDRHKVESLKKLTNIRKVMLASESAMVRVRLVEKEKEIHVLKEPVFDGSSISEINSLVRYQAWRQQEIPRLIGEQAKLKSELSIAQRSLGKAIAEDETADHLKERLKVEKQIKEARKAETSSSSHLLAHNISDQDI